MDFSITKISIFFIVICIFLFSCNNELIKKWRRANNNLPNIKLEKKGKNGIGGNYLIESSSNLNSGIREHEYYLKNAEGQTHKLDIELNWKEYQIIFFEFTKSSLFIIITSSGSDDWIAFKKFSLETGELIFRDGGMIPCEKKIKAIDPTVDFWTKKNDWSLGNRKCTWINFQSHQISYLRSNLVRDSEIDNLWEYNIFSYNWMENKLDTLPQNFSVGLEAVTGYYVVYRNINYNYEKGQFEY